MYFNFSNSLLPVISLIDINSKKNPVCSQMTFFDLLLVPILILHPVCPVCVCNTRRIYVYCHSAFCCTDSVCHVLCILVRARLFELVCSQCLLLLWPLIRFLLVHVLITFSRRTLRKQSTEQTYILQFRNLD